MFENLLTSAFDAGSEVFIQVKGFGNPLRGRVQDLNGEHFTLFQDGRYGTILWAFKIKDVMSCGLLVGPPLHEDDVDDMMQEPLGGSYNESDN